MPPDYRRDNRAAIFVTLDFALGYKPDYQSMSKIHKPKNRPRFGALVEMNYG